MTTEEKLRAIAENQQNIYDAGYNAGKAGYVTLAETILTEDASEIIWTQGANGEVLSDYKDFFIYWVGKFDKDATNEVWICKANGGVTYFCYAWINKSTNMSGYWWEIKEIGQLPDGTSLYKTTFPEKCLMSFWNDFAYGAQGLAGNNKAVQSDISTGTTIEHIRFGSLSSGSKMVAGSKAILLGRKR